MNSIVFFLTIIIKWPTKPAIEFLPSNRIKNCLPYVKNKRNENLIIKIQIASMKGHSNRTKQNGIEMKMISTKKNNKNESEAKKKEPPFERL